MSKRLYQKLYEKAKSLIKAEGCMKFYNKKEALDLETVSLD